MNLIKACSTLLDLDIIEVVLHAHRLDIVAEECVLRHTSHFTEHHFTHFDLSAIEDCPLHRISEA
jgi:hypothetical protein